MRSIRWTTFVRDFGPVMAADSVSDAEWKKAVNEGRFATVYHGESDWVTPLQAIPRHHGCVNTICKIAFKKPLPESIGAIVGLRDNQSAHDICRKP